MKELPSSTFCPMPFMHVATKTYGAVKLCCRSQPVGDLNSSSLGEIWNNDSYRRVRQQLLAGEKPSECKICWNDEAHGIRSLRQKFITSQLKDLDFMDQLQNDFSLPMKIRRIEIKLNNVCNLKCRMCSPVDSTKWLEDWPTVQHLSEKHNESIHNIMKTGPPRNNFFEEDRFWKDFESLAPTLEQIDFAGGEPLLDPFHYKVLEKIEQYADKIHLKYSTNLSQPKFVMDRILEMWKKFKFVTVTVSIDGLKNINEYIRQGSSVSLIETNIKRIQDSRSSFAIIGSCTVQAYNVFSLPEIFDYFVEELNIDINTHKVQYPHYLDARIVPSSYKKIVLDKLKTYAESIDGKLHGNWSRLRKGSAIKNTADIINFLNSKSLNDCLPAFVEFSDLLDKKQNVQTTWRNLLPELEKSISTF